MIMANLEMGIFEAKLLKNQGEIGFQSWMNLEGVTFETYSTTCDFLIEDLDMICQFFQKFLVLSEDLTVSIKLLELAPLLSTKGKHCIMIPEKQSSFT